MAPLLHSAEHCGQHWAASCCCPPGYELLGNVAKADNQHRLAIQRLPQGNAQLLALNGGSHAVLVAQGGQHQVDGMLSARQGIACARTEDVGNPHASPGGLQRNAVQQGEACHVGDVQLACTV